MTDPASDAGPPHALWLLRHGQRVDQVDPTWAETVDNPHDPGLTDWGHEQADRAGRRLRDADPGIDAVYVSPFTRAVQTADAVATHLDLPVYVEDGLCEHLNPAWFDHAPTVPTAAEHARSFETVSPDHDPVLRPTFPESGEAAADRASETARRLLAGSDDRTLLLVGHGLTVGGITAGLTGADVDVPLAGLTRLETDADDAHETDEWHVALAAETSHYD
jgi:broad specificity phosphatase PhoE